MIKKTLLYILMLMGIMIIPSCHGSKGMAAFQMPDTFDTTQTYEITFWAKNDTNKVQTEIYKKTIEDFQKLYPNIKVILRLYTNYGDIYNDVITNISTNTTPNVCITYPDHIATYMTGTNIVVPLDSLIENEKYGLGGNCINFESIKKEEIVPQFFQEGIIQNKSYALPFMRSTEACYINKEYVEKLGYKVPDIITWDFIWEVSEKAMEMNDDDTYKLNNQNVLIPFIYKSTDNMMIHMLHQKGGGYSDQNGNIRIFNNTTKELLYNIAEHSKTRAFSTFKISSYPANFLNAGQCIFAVDSTAGATWMGTYAPLSDISEDKLVKFTTEVRPVPQFNTEKPAMISQGPSVCIFNKANHQEVLASWIFAQYLLTDKVQTAYSETEGYIPVTLKAQNSEEYRKYLSEIGSDREHYDVKIKASELLMDNIDSTFVTPVFNGSASLRDAAGQLIENTVKSVRREKTIDEAFMDELFNDVNSLYRLDQSSATGNKKEKLGPLPGTSIILLTSLAIVWILLIIYGIINHIRKFKR